MEVLGVRRGRGSESCLSSSDLQLDCGADRPCTLLLRRPLQIKVIYRRKAHGYGIIIPALTQ